MGHTYLGPPRNVVLSGLVHSTYRVARMPKFRLLGCEQRPTQHAWMFTKRKLTCLRCIRWDLLP